MAAKKKARLLTLNNDIKDTLPKISEVATSRGRVFIQRGGGPAIPRKIFFNELMC